VLLFLTNIEEKMMRILDTITNLLIFAAIFTAMAIASRNTLYQYVIHGYKKSFDLI